MDCGGLFQVGFWSRGNFKIWNLERDELTIFDFWNEEKNFFQFGILGSFGTRVLFCFYL